MAKSVTNFLERAQKVATMEKENAKMAAMSKKAKENIGQLQEDLQLVKDEKKIVDRQLVELDQTSQRYINNTTVNLLNPSLNL